MSAAQFTQMFSPLELTEDFTIESDLLGRPIMIALYEQREDGQPENLIMDWTLVPVTIKAGKYWWAMKVPDA